MFLRFFLPLALMVLGGVWVYGKAELERQLTTVRSVEMLNVGRGAGAMTGTIDTVSRDLLFLSTHSALRQAVSTQSVASIENLAHDFANFSAAKQIYDQLRWIDETGMERVRVDLVQGKPVNVVGDKLQNKGKRYFFTDSFKLNPGEIFISPLDLNIEQNAIEVPYKPMIRVATPVTDDSGAKRGIVILNYYGKEMLRAFAEASSDIANHVMVLNGDGYWLKSPVAGDEWGFMFKKPELSLAARSPAAWALIGREDRGQVRLEDGLWTWQTVYPLVAGAKSSTGAADAFVPSRGEIETRQYVWKSVAHLPSAQIDGMVAEVVGRLAPVAALILALFAFISWKLAAAWQAQALAEAEVRRVNAGLEVTVAERTEELRRKLIELDEANAGLEQKNEEMESMIYAASHDLRSPLVNIQGFGQRLEKATGEIADRLKQDDVPETVRASLTRLLQEKIPSALGFIKSSSLKMDALISALLRLSRAGRTQLNIVPVDMNALLAEVVGNLMIQVQAAGAEVAVDELVPCQGDAVQLNQVFSNLIDNALKYRDPARPLRIAIRSEPRDDRVCYHVADTGPGIAEEFQSRVWQLFHRLDPAGKVAGEGLGLTLVKRIVERLHGHVTLSSTPGQGSCFTVDLPAAVASPPEN